MSPNATQFGFDLEQPQFVNSEVIEIVQCTLATLQTWANRGIIVPSGNAAPGNGRRRFYSAIDVCKVQILSRLTEFGFPPSDSKQIAEWVGARIKSGRSITKDHRLLITRKPFQLEVIGAPAPTVTGLGDYFYQEFEGENQVRHGVEHMYQNLFSREDANELIKLNLPFGAMVVKTMNTLRKLSGDEKPE